MSMNMFGGHMVPGISVVEGFGPSESATWRLGTSGYVVWPLGELWYAVWPVAGYPGPRGVP